MMRNPTRVTINFDCNGPSWQGDLFWNQLRRLLVQIFRKIKIERYDAEGSAGALFDIDGNRCGEIVVDFEDGAKP